jgi:hypothetical protein
MMLNKFKLTIFISLIFWLITPVAQATLPLPANLIALNSPAGEKLFYRSAHTAYWPLSLQFLTQENLAYCAIASGVMVFNALGVSLPNDPTNNPYQVFTQDNFFTPEIQKIITPDHVQHHGTALDELGQAMATFPVQVKVVHADQTTLEKFRAATQQAISHKNTYIIVNFVRTGIKEQGGGYFSPLAAYDRATDRFLLMDVARYKYQPVWVTTKDLWAAIDTMDEDIHKYRGFLIVKI